MNKVFFLVETIDRSKHYKPTNKIIIDVQAGVNLFHDRIGLVKHVVELTKDLCDKWNTKYYNQPQVNLKKVNLSLHSLCPPSVGVYVCLNCLYEPSSESTTQINLV